MKFRKGDDAILVTYKDAKVDLVTQVVVKKAAPSYVHVHESMAFLFLQSGYPVNARLPERIYTKQDWECAGMKERALGAIDRASDKIRRAQSAAEVLEVLENLAEERKALACSRS